MAAAKRTNKGSFEDALRRLEEIVGRLEEGGVPLDDVMTMYEEGVVLAKECLDRLSKAEATLKRLTKNADGSFGLLDGIDDE